MKNIILPIILIEVFALLIAYIGSWFIGVANREDEELKTFRKLFFVVIVISMNLIIFLKL